jgi:hypothetical protein
MRQVSGAAEGGAHAGRVTGGAPTMKYHTFRLHFPGGYDAVDRFDFQALQSAGTIQHWRDSAGHIRLRFAPPFADVSVVDDETLTVEKAAAFYAAVRHFGATKENQ